MKNAENRWSLQKDGLQGCQITDALRALIANGVEAGTIQCGRPKEQKFWISFTYRDSFFLLNFDAHCFEFITILLLSVSRSLL
ncbi:hypothetical protein ES332_D01G174400v1 [Gossypium tomentosum]|uniref:Uncharacterized protein n=1 Tax=Gossypium tomentosum TaxID=34277 RepID=A0A5D2MAF8_GOSTO|nr:hypothetical protein ES332_D01G174400v1 [Gossypium tomentosum]